MVKLAYPVFFIILFAIFLQGISNRDGGALKRDMKNFLGPSGNASEQTPRQHAIDTIYSRAS